MTDQELAEIEARWKASTPGEWEENNVGVYSKEAYMTEFLYYHLGGYDGESYNPNSDDDNKFIIQAHNTDIPALLAEVRRLQSDKLKLENNLTWSVYIVDDISNGTEPIAIFQHRDLAEVWARQNYGNRAIVKPK